MTSMTETDDISYSQKCSLWLWYETTKMLLLLLNWFVLLVFQNVMLKTALSTVHEAQHVCVDGIIQPTAEGKVNSLSCGLDECA